MQAMRQAHFRRMQLCVVGGCRRLMSQQVATRPSFVKSGIAFAAALAQGEGDRAVGKTLVHSADPFLQHSVRKKRVLAALQHKSAKAQRVAMFAAGQEILQRQAVARGRAIAATNAAIEAVVFADVRDLDEPAQIDRIAIHLAAHSVRLGVEIGVCLRRAFVVEP